MSLNLIVHVFQAPLERHGKQGGNVAHFFAVHGTQSIEPIRFYPERANGFATKKQGGDKHGSYTMVDSLLFDRTQVGLLAQIGNAQDLLLINGLQPYRMAQVSEGDMAGIGEQAVGCRCVAVV